MKKLGAFIKRKREKLFEKDKSYSQRQICQKIGFEQSYLSKIERGVATQLSEDRIIALAEVLGENPDYMLALGEKVSNDVLDIIKQRPMLFSRLIRAMKNLPNEAIEVESEFNNIMSALSNLHDIALIGAFRISNDKQASFITKQTLKILGLEANTPPTLEALKAQLPEEQKALLSDALEKSKKNGRPVRFELTVMGKDAHEKNITVWSYFEKDPIAKTETHLGILQDVTESSMLRKELDSANQMLEIEVDKQTKTTTEAIAELKQEISKRKLFQQRLSDLNKDISRKSSVQNQTFKEIAFQIRTLASQIISKSNLNDVAETGLTEMLSRLTYKVDCLGDLIGEEYGEGGRTTFNVRKTISSVLAESQKAQSSDEKGINYSQSPNMPPFIKAEEPQIKRVINELLELMFQITEWGNFQVTATIEEGPHLIVSLYTSAAVGPISIKDFYPTDKESSTLKLLNPVRGVGPLVTALDGDLSVVMPSNSEVSIRLSLPIEIASAPSQAEEPLARMNEARRILIVEDDPFNRLFLEKGLKNNSYIVEAVTTGKEAIHRLREQDYDAVLLDIQLPDIPGTEVVETLANDAEQRNTKTPIIAVTAHAASDDKKRFRAAGITDVISKPFELSDLLQRLNNLL